MDKYTYIYFGTIVAAMITGAVAYITLVVNKENNVSNFRQDWINSLREEISTFVSLIYSYHWLMRKGKFEPDYGFIHTHIENAKTHGLIKNIQNLEKNESDDKYFQILIENEIKTSLSGFSELERVIFEIHNNYNKIKYRLNKDEIHMNLKLLKLLDSLYKQFNLKTFDDFERKYHFTIEEYVYPNVENCNRCNDLAYENYTVDITFDYQPNSQCSTTELITQYSQAIESETSKILKFEWNRVKDGEQWFKRSKLAFLYAFIGSILILAFFMIVNYSKILS